MCGLLRHRTTGTWVAGQKQSVCALPGSPASPLLLRSRGHDGG